MRPTKVYIRCIAGDGNNWTVSLKVVDAEYGNVLHESPESFCLADPWTVDGYRKHLNPLRRPDAENDRVALKTYGEKLANQLNLRHILVNCFCEKLYIFEDFRSERNTKNLSIHSILWEVLEDRDFWPGLESSAVARRGPLIIRVVLRESKEPLPNLKSVHRQRSCRILLVLARALHISSRSDYNKQEASPGLIQNVLTSIAKFLDSKGASSYLTLHVVRPGTFEQLGRFLSADTYDIVHFDLHGHISQRVAKLRFAVQPGSDKLGKEPTLDDNPEYDDQSIEKVAELLHKHRISKVALNSCKSAYALQSATTNMARILIGRGVASVCAMSYDIYDDAAGPYYKAFYEAFILDQKDFHEAASLGRQKLRQRFEKQIEREHCRAQGEYEHLIPVSYRGRANTMKNEFHRPHIPLRERFGVPFAVTLPLLASVADGMALPGYVDLLQKSAWLSRCVSQFLRFLWVLFLVWVFWSVYTGSGHGLELARISEHVRSVRRTAYYTLRRTDLRAQYRDFRRQQKSRHGRASEFKFSLGHMDLEEKLHRHKCLYLYHNDATKRQIRALVRVWIQTGFIDSAVFKDANRFFDLWHRLSWNWTAIRVGNRRPRGQYNPEDERGPRHLIVIENIDHFVTNFHEEFRAENPDRRGRSVALDGGVVKDLDDWISCQGTEASYILLTGSSPHSRHWWLGLKWAGKIKDRWKVVQPYELRE